MFMEDIVLATTSIYDMTCCICVDVNVRPEDKQYHIRNTACTTQLSMFIYPVGHITPRHADSCLYNL